MVKETMTIRKALTQKKVLDNQIAELSSTKFVAVATSNRTVIDGLKQKDWVSDAKARFQSLNDIKFSANLLGSNNSTAYWSRNSFSRS